MSNFHVVKNFFKALAFGLVLCYSYPSSIFPEYQMVVAYHRSPGVDFFTNCYRELYEAHASGPTVTPALYRAARPTVERWLVSYWRYRWPKIHCLAIEDIVQDGFEYIAKYMIRYRFVCPNCGSEHETEIDYNNHCESEHNTRLIPKVSLSTYVSLNAMGRMRNVMRDHIKDRRGNDVTLGFEYIKKAWLSTEASEGSGVAPHTVPEPLVDRSFKPYHQALSSQRLERFRERAERERDHRVKSYMFALLKYGDSELAHQELVDMGLYKNRKSAKERMRLWMKAGRFNSYRKDLEG